MVGMGGSSNSRDPSEVGISTREVIAVLGGTMIGVSVLLLGVSGIIMSLPHTELSSNIPITKMLSPDEAAKAAGDRLKAARLEQAKALENPPGKHYSPSSRRMENIRIASSDEAAKAARARRLANLEDSSRYRGSIERIRSNIRAAGAEEFETEGIERCEDERSFLLELLTDRQLNEFIEYIEEEYGEEGYKKVEKEYYAETLPPWEEFLGLKKDSCCCGATIMSPCACMFEGVMDCSAVEPKCPCYEWPSNINSPIELNNYESKCPRCKTDLTEEWWEEVHDEELGDWEVEEGGRAKFYRTWYGNCPSCRSYLELPDYNYDIGEDMVGWEPSYIDRAESFSAEYVPEEMIPIGTKVRSYDFWPRNKKCYKEGVIVDHAPSPSCSPNCLHYHIRTTKVVMGGKLYSEENGEIFMTHPYTDIFDEDYSAGKLASHIQIISTAFPSTSIQ